MNVETDNQNRYETALFSGGCFWCMVEPFEEEGGVIEVVAGYTGGTTENPTYESVSQGATDHFEAVKITFDPELIDYGRLVEIFWRQIDPTDGGGQFADRGNHYRTAIFFTSSEQKEVAQKSKTLLEDTNIFDKPVVTMILPATRFYPAEEYHQNYHQKNIMHYNAYKKGSGRADFIKRVWRHRELPQKAYQKPDEAELRDRLSQLEFDVTQKDATEPPFANAFWDNKRDGIYLDVVSGEPLFSSTDKYDSGTGWPSFSKPLEEDNIVEKEDRKLLSVRTEVRSKIGDSHLGHVFPDGPAPTGLRYCINSAALRFVPADELAKEGLERYTSLFFTD